MRSFGLGLNCAGATRGYSTFRSLLLRLPETGTGTAAILVVAQSGAWGSCFDDREELRCWIGMVLPERQPLKLPCTVASWKVTGRRTTRAIFSSERIGCPCDW